MSQFNQQEYMKCQIEEIKKYKWIQSEKCGRDLGNEAVKDWITKYSIVFRQQWNKTHEN